MARKTKEIALRERYERLELALLDRVSTGIEKIVRRKDGSEERTIEYPDRLAVALLKKFERLQKRLGKEDPERG